VLALLSLAQNAVILAIAVGLGLLLARKVGRGAPILEAWLAGEAAGARLRPIVRTSILCGAAIGAVGLAALLALLKHLPDLPLRTEARVAAWKRLLACFYGGFFEEILTHLFVLSLAAWLLGTIWRGADGLPSTPAFWTANVFVAILFGLGHLPAASLMMTITPPVVAVAIGLNGIAAVAFGYLFWTRGLEAAMLAHFSGDLVLHVIGPAFVGT
jgi:hypothetical protein